MTIRISLDTTGADKKIGRLFRKARDLSPLMADISEYMLQATQDRFDDETDPDGVPWEQLSPSTVEAKARKGQDPGILKADGFLFDLLTSDFGSLSAEVMSDLEYAATHQFGDPARGIPEREFLGFSFEDEGEIESLVDQFLA